MFAVFVVQNVVGCVVIVVLRVVFRVVNFCGRERATFFELPWCALRGRRSLRDMYTPSVGAPVGRDEKSSADQREAQGEAGIHVTK